MSRSSLLLLLVLAAGSRALAAQTKAQAQTPAAATAPASSGFDSFIMLVPPQDTISIKKQLKGAAEAVNQAESRRQQAETMRLGARGRIESKKVEIVRIKDRLNLAKKESRDADRVGLEAERKAAEREKGLFERREELRQSEIELEAARGELAGLTQKALQLELQLAIRRAGRSRKPLGGAGGASLDQVIGELEKQTLEAQRAQAGYNPVVANQEIKVIDRRLELLEAQQKLLGGN
jgi:chromosome segregation ATPase